MTKNILEWGWHTSTPTSSSSTSDWKPAPTLLGRHSGDIDVAAAGDLKCEGICSQGGSWGTTGAYDVDGAILCRNCAVKTLKIEDLSGAEQNILLRPHELQAK